MGWSVNNLIVGGLTPEEVAHRLHCTLGPERLTEEDATVSSRSPSASLAVLPDGRVLVTDPHGAISETDYEDLSAVATVHQILVEEHVMASSASCWVEGVQQWSLSHESDDGDGQQLRKTGAPPATAARLLSGAQRQAQEDHDVDYVFDVPVDVIEAETGFRHDVAHFDQDDEAFVVLTTDPKPPPAARRGLFRRR